MERLTEKRNGTNVIPLRNAICGTDMPYWKITTAGDLTEYLSGNAADRLAAYEDTGLEPEEIKELSELKTSLTDAEQKMLNDYLSLGSISRLRELAEADKDGRCMIVGEKLTLSMLAGAYAIESNKRYDSATFVHGVHAADPKKISYYEAAALLYEAAKAALEEINRQPAEDKP